MNKNMMTQATVPTAEVLAWAEQIRALRAETLRPIASADDPRWAELVALGPVASFPDWDDAAEFLGELYFGKVTMRTAPACPVPVPAWVDTRVLGLSEWPVVTLWDSGQEWESAGVSAHLSQMTQVVVDEMPADEPDPLPVGTVTPMQVYVEVISSEGAFGFTVDEAAAVECVIGDALHTVRAEVSA